MNELDFNDHCSFSSSRFYTLDFDLTSAILHFIFNHMIQEDLQYMDWLIPVQEPLHPRLHWLLFETPFR